MEWIERVNQYLRGWMGYFGISKLYGSIPELDSWLRRRIRMGSGVQEACQIV